MSFVAVAIGGSAILGLGGAALGANAAGNAADAQMNAANYAAQLQYQASQNALGFQKDVYNDQKANQAPWIQAGQSAINNLNTLAGQPFVAPTSVTEQNDPGYKFRLQQGQDAIQHSAAARGGLLTGGTAKALADYNQNAASGEYGNVYNRAMNEYTMAYNRLANVAGLGQTAAGQMNNASGNMANGVSANMLGTAANMGQQYNNAGAATASGYIGAANAWGGAMNNMGNLGMQYGMMNYLNQAQNPYAMWNAQNTGFATPGAAANSVVG